MKERFYVEDPTTGEKKEVWLRPGFSDAEMQAEINRVFPKTGPMTHAGTTPSPPPEIRPPGFVETPLDFWQSYQAGRARGNPEEVQAALGGKIAVGPDERMYWQPEGTSEWRAVDRPGLSWQDAPRIAGEVVPQTVGGAIGALMGKTPAGMVFKGALGGGLGTLADEAVQLAQGTQRDALPAVLQRAGTATLEEGLGGVLGLGLARMGNAALPGGRPLRAGSDYVQDQLEGAIRLSREIPEFPPPLAGDIYSNTVGPAGMPAPIAAGMQRQADGMTGAIANLRTDMTAAAGEATRNNFMLPPFGKEAAQDSLVRMAEGAWMRVKDAVGRLGPGAEAGAYQTRVGAEAANAGARGLVSQRYEGPLANALRSEQPMFDLGPAQTRWNAPRLTGEELLDAGILDARGMPILAQIQNQLEVIPEATGRISYLKRVLATLDPEQQGEEAFNALKKIRTEVGSMLQDPAFRDFKGNPANRLYAELSEVLKNPVNAGDVPTYLKEFENANLLEGWFRGLLDDASVAKALKSTDAASVVRAMASDPESVLTPRFREFMDLAPEGHRDLMRKAAQQSILDNPDPARLIDEMPIASNPEAFNYLFRDAAEKARFMDNANRISRFTNSPEGQMYAARNKGFETLKFALDEVTDPRSAETLMRNLPRSERPLYRQAIIDNAVDKAFRPNTRGIWAVEPGALGKEIGRLQKTGQWALLDEGQRRRLKDLESYYRIVLNKTGDVGASLENAAIVADFKRMLYPPNWLHPALVSRSLDVVGTMRANRWVKNFVTHPGRAEKLMRRIERTATGKASVDLGPAGAMAGILLAPAGFQMFGEGVLDPLLQD